MLSVLWLARELPYPHRSADQLLSYELSCAVARMGVHVTLLGLKRDSSVSAPATCGIDWIAVDARPRSRLLSLASWLPLVAARFRVPAYKRAIATLLSEKQFHAIVIDQYALGWACGLITALAPSVPIVHLAHDFETSVNSQIARNFRGSRLRRIALLWNAFKTARLEAVIARKAALICVQTEQDAASFRSLGAMRTIVFEPGYSGRRVSGRDLGSSTPKAVAIFGSFTWTAKQIDLKNFLESAVPLAALHGITINIVGHIPNAFAAQLAQYTSTVRFHGYVDDLESAFSQNRIGLVIDETGGGFKYKTLDYVFHRLPVAAVAPAMIGVNSNLLQHIAIYQDTASMVRGIVDLIDDTSTLSSMQRGAFDVANGLFSWDRAGQSLVDAIYDMSK